MRPDRQLELLKDVAVKFEYVMQHAQSQMTLGEMIGDKDISWLELFNRLGVQEVEKIINAVAEAYGCYTDYMHGGPEAPFVD